MRKWAAGTASLAAVFLLNAAGPLCAAPNILTIFSDSGISGNSLFTWSANSNALFGPSTAVAPPEGYSSLLTQSNSNLWAGWGVFYNTAQDLSAYSTGELRFWLYASDGNLLVQLEDINGTKLCNQVIQNLQGWNSSLLNTWVEVRIRLAGIPLNQIKSPFEITAQVATNFYVDQVRFVDNTVPDNFFSVALVNRSDGSPASSLSWSRVALPARWVLADQYLQLTVDPNNTSWGVQIYTNNTAAGANPRYTGSVSTFTTTPPVGGLVNPNNTPRLLPLAWEAMESSSPTLKAQDPNNCGPSNGLACLWLFMQDQAVFGNGNATAYNGAPWITARNNVGIHYAQGVTIDPSDFGAANTPDAVYLEADFGTAVAPTTYQTSTLTIEYYTP